MKVLQMLGVESAVIEQICQINDKGNKKHPKTVRSSSANNPGVQKNDYNSRAKSASISPQNYEQKIRFEDQETSNLTPMSASNKYESSADTGLINQAQELKVHLRHLLDKLKSQIRHSFKETKYKKSHARDAALTQAIQQ